MERLWMAGAILVGAMVMSPPTLASDAATHCALTPPADGDLATEAARFFPTAKDIDVDALIACMADPDPAIRDDFAFTLWSAGLRGNHMSPDAMRRAAAQLVERLADPDDMSGVRRPFAALALSEVARADRIKEFLSAAELHALAEASAAYMRGISDYRGFIVGEGWRHGVAHDADLMLQLALNPRLARADVDTMLAAIAMQIAPAGNPYYRHGEPGRLARPVLFLAKRADLDDAAWAAWFKTLHPDAHPRWQAPYASDAGLAAVHNSTGFAQAIYVNSAESQDPAVRRLAPLALAMLRALP